MTEEWNDTECPMLIVNYRNRQLPKSKRPPYVGGWRKVSRGVYFRRLRDGRTVIVRPEKWAILQLHSVGLVRKEEKR